MNFKRHSEIETENLFLKERSVSTARRNAGIDSAVLY